MPEERLMLLRADFEAAYAEHGSWGAAAIERIFDRAVFGPGLMGIDSVPPGGPLDQGVAIVVPSGEPVLAEAFEIRDRLPDSRLDEFWSFQAARWHFMGHPGRPCGLLGHRVEATVCPTARASFPAEPLIRTFVFDIFAMPDSLLSRFSRRGSVSWLMPQEIAEREQRRGRLGSLVETLSYCLPLGRSSGDEIKTLALARDYRTMWAGGRLGQ